jgi:hypothetical protein
MNPLPLPKHVTISAIAISVISSAVALANAIISLSGPIHVLAAMHAGKIIAAASIVAGVGAVLAGLGKSPLEAPPGPAQVVNASGTQSITGAAGWEPPENKQPPQ